MEVSEKSRLIRYKDSPSNLCVQTGSGAKPASCPMGTRDPFSGAKRGRGVTLPHTPIYCRGREWVGAIYIFSPPCAFVGVLRDCFILYFGLLSLGQFRFLATRGWWIDVGAMIKVTRVAWVRQTARCSEQAMHRSNGGRPASSCGRDSGVPCALTCGPAHHIRDTSTPRIWLAPVGSPGPGEFRVTIFHLSIIRTRYVAYKPVLIPSA
jgi:hypothetical protein